MHLVSHLYKEVIRVAIRLYKGTVCNFTNVVLVGLDLSSPPQIVPKFPIPRNIRSVAACDLIY